MELGDRTVMLLGGSGLVGHAVARRVLGAEPAPRRLVLVALFEDEVRAAARALDSYRGSVTIDVEWGNVFMPAAVARLDLAVVMGDAGHRALVLGDLYGDLTEPVLERSLLFQLLLKYKPDAVVDSINTATAFAYQDIFHSARQLHERARDGGVDQAMVEQHLLRLTLPQLIRHAQIITEGLHRAGTKEYIKIGTSGTGGMGFNIPYTHSEEKPSRTLLTKSAVAGAHSMLLFLLGRTPDSPVTIEIKPTATIAWREVAYGPVRRKGKPIPLVDCDAPVPLRDAFQDTVRPWRDLGRSLDGVYIDVGENGLFARDEFETVTALGQMEFITPEEVADYVMMELQGRPTGKDVIAALDASTAGPTYRAGMLRRNAVGRLRSLEEREGKRGVAYEMLGPPRLTKMLYEAYLCRQLCPTVRALAESKPPALAAAAYRLLQGDAALRQHIISVGLPIVAPDGKHVYRGSTVVVPPPSGPNGDPLSVAPRGWVDLRPDQFGVWINRAAAMVRDAEARAAGPPSSGSDLDWNAIEPEDAIEPSRFATWVFTVEEKGARIKR